MAALGFLLYATPTCIWLALKIMPNTPIGRRIILMDNRSDEQLARDHLNKVEEAAAIDGLIGAQGRALTDLRPGGTIRIDGEDVEAFAETGYVEAGNDVEVVSVHGRQIKVRQVKSNA